MHTVIKKVVQCLCAFFVRHRQKWAKNVRCKFKKVATDTSYMCDEPVGVFYDYLVP
jgi:hypothetical protein